MNEKIILVYPNVMQSKQMPIGLASISAVLKKNNYEVFLWDGTFDSIYFFKDMLRHIEPYAICFTALSPDYELVKTLADYVKNFNKNIKTIIGGPHATFLPHEIIMDNFDAVIIGEGENIIIDYLQSNDEKLYNIWIKEKLESSSCILIRPNILPPPDVTKLPWPDHEIFERHFDRDATWSEIPGRYTVFMTARGCPFQCTYCYSKGMQDLYKGNKYTRYREIDDVIKEVKFVVDKYDIKSLYFIDETLTTNKKRILDLCEKYKKEINLPWHCETRPNVVDEEIFTAMKEANCEVVMMGIESGSDRIRNGIYNRNLKEKQIIKAFHLAKKCGLKTSSFNICGAPTETSEEILQTIVLNKKCKVDYGKMTIFTAFPGSQLYNFCKENDYYMRKKYPTNYYIDSNVMVEISLEDLMRYRKEFVKSLGGYTGAKNKGEY